MRRKIHITDHGVHEIEDSQEEITATGDPATDPLGETVYEPAPDSEGNGAADPALLLRVAELESQLEAERDKNLRTMADFQNFRRRMEEEKRSFAQFANEELIRAMLPILDNFERALAAAEKNKSFETLVGGVALTHRQVQDLLKKSGVEPIETKGRQFDPNFHEAVDRVEGSGADDNSIVDELQRGYTINSKVLRPSLVRVAGG